MLITVRDQSVDFLLDSGTTYSMPTEAPGPTFFLICFHNGTVMMSQNVLLLQCFCQLGLRFGAIFIRVSDCARVSLTPFGEGYTKQGLCLCFHEYEIVIVNTKIIQHCLHSIKLGEAVLSQFF